MLSWKSASAVVILAWCLSDILFPPQLDADLFGKFAVVTGGSRGSGRGFVQGLSEAGATVYITGRNRDSLDEACASVPGPGKCIAKLVDSADDASLETFFAEVRNETGGRLDVLVNNAYSGVGWWGKRKLLGKPFWEQGMGLYDAVHQVGVRSHYKATLLALPLLRQATGRGLIVNTNSLGCLIYGINVPYGIGKCAIDKMSSGMAMELQTEGIDVVSWWAKEPMQTDEILQGNVDGTSSRRGMSPGLTGLRFDELFHTALAGTLFFEGRVLAAFARDTAGRAAFSGLAVQTGQLAGRYRVVDERGIRSPQFLTLKFNFFAWIPILRRFTELPNPAALTDTPPTCTPAQRFVFDTLPDGAIPQWIFKLLSGNPVTMQWPLS